MNNRRQYRDRLLENNAYVIEAGKGDLIMDVTEAICDILEREGISRQELANRIGRSKGFVSQVLNGSRNMTLNTLSEIAQALGYTPNFKMERYVGEKYLVGNYEYEIQPEKCVYESRVVNNE